MNTASSERKNQITPYTHHDDTKDHPYSVFLRLAWVVFSSVDLEGETLTFLCDDVGSSPKV